MNYPDRKVKTTPFEVKSLFVSVTLLLRFIVWPSARLSLFSVATLKSNNWVYWEL